MRWGSGRRGFRGRTSRWSSRTCSCSQCARRRWACRLHFRRPLRAAPYRPACRPAPVPSSPVVPHPRALQKGAEQPEVLCQQRALCERQLPAASTAHMQRKLHPPCMGCAVTPGLHSPAPFPMQDATHFRRTKDAAGKDVLEPCSPGEPGAFAATLQVGLQACRPALLGGPLLQPAAPPRAVASSKSVLCPRPPLQCASLGAAGKGEGRRQLALAAPSLTCVPCCPSLQTLADKGMAGMVHPPSITFRDFEKVRLPAPPGSCTLESICNTRHPVCTG